MNKELIDFVDDQNSLTMEVVITKHKPYTPEYKLSAILDPDGSTWRAWPLLVQRDSLKFKFILEHRTEFDLEIMFLAPHQHLTGLGPLRRISG